MALKHSHGRIGGTHGQDGGEMEMADEVGGEIEITEDDGVWVKCELERVDEDEEVSRKLWLVSFKL